MRIGMKNRLFALILLGSLAVSCAGCGKTETEAGPETVELLEPVGVSAIYETAALRNMYSITTYPASVSPYVEEYSFESGQRFMDYATYPGEHVARGGGLIDTDTQSIDQQIEDLEKSIADMEESYAEYMSEADETLYDLNDDDAQYSQVLKNFEEQKPEETVETTQEDGTVTQEPNPEYESWLRDYNYWDGIYHRNLQSLLEQKENMRQRTELYEMDHEYNLSRLEYLKKQRSQSKLLSGMAGEVMALQFFNSGDYIAEDVPVMAVGDLDRKLIRSEFVSASAIRAAKDVYALIDGVRFEVEYEPMDADEYARIQKRDGTVYTTFYFKDQVPDIPVGTYCTIVVVSGKREQVLSVSTSAIHSEGLSYYVYVEKDGESVYTPVKTGFRDDAYVEIVSGLSEGDRVRTDSVEQAGDETVVLGRGTISYGFSSTGYLYYPDTISVTNPVKYGTCYITEYELTLYQQVKKGEVLARIRVVADDVAYARLTRNLQRQRERLEDLKKDGEEKNEKAIEDMLETIADLEKQIKDMEDDAAVTEILSPIDGVVLSPEPYEEEELIRSDALVCILADQTRSYVVVEDENHQLNYGDVLDVTYSAFGTDKTVQGTVLTLNQRSLSGPLREASSSVLISVPAQAIPEMAFNAMFTGGFWNRRSFNVSGKVRSVSNVVLVPKEAVSLKSGGTYVDIVQPDGSVVSQSFVAGGSDNRYYWVVEGLSEGMEICLR